MKNKLQQKLIQKYPKIFSTLSFGFECKSGWYKLIDNLCELLQYHTDHNQYQQVEATQIKSKYGGLRFYTTTSNEYTDGMIDFAETLSYKICEVCGSMEDVSQTKGWVKTRCRNCKEQKR